MSRLLRASILLALLAPAAALRAQSTTVLAAADRRSAISLDGEWRTIIDPSFAGLYDFHHHEKKDGWFLNQKAAPTDSTPVEYDFAASPTLKVPGDWNTQRPELFFYEGPVWYERGFDYHLAPGKRVFLHVGAANYRSWFWVNGVKVCQHEGGFTSFDCEVTRALHDGGNFIVAAVDNTRLPDGLPAMATDWWNYGGLTRDLSLIETPESFVDDYDLHLNRADRTRISGWVHVQGARPGAEVEVRIPELGAKAAAGVGAGGRAPISLRVPGIVLWSPQNPKLYRVVIHAGQDELDDEMGFRTIEVQGTKILLNGKPIFLRGISIQGEAPYRTGRVYSEQDVDRLLGWAQELGCNYVRLPHFPHDVRMTRAADRLGLLVWSEIPVYWAVDFNNPEVLLKAESQLSEMVRRDRDKASVIFWAIANETPETPERTEFLSTLAAKARALDPSRLVTAALLVRSQGNTKIVDDPLGKSLDVLGVNEYVGWYEGRPESADTTQWRIAYSKPVIVSEFGGGAKAGLHGGPDQRWTEEYQANLFRHQLGMLNRIPQLRGMSPWVLMDFRAPYRQLPGIQDYFNRKGLISDQGQKKEAFFVLQKAYRERLVGKAQ